MVMEYPINQIEFETEFNSEQKCLHYLTKVRWPDGFVCPRCASRGYWKMGNLFKCKKCMYQLSATAGTIFHRSKKPLMVWFRALWWIVAQKNGVSALGLTRILGLGSYRTAWTWLHKLRRLMVVPGREKLSGTVEVDETFVGGKKTGKRGRGVEGKALVIIALEVPKYGTGRVRLEIAPDASGKSLKAFILNNIERGATITTDGWKGYRNVSKWGYGHKVEKAILKDNEEILPNVHRVAALLKRWLLGTHQNYASSAKLAYYLDEYTFRHNRRTSRSRGLLFRRLVEQGVNQAPITHREIICN